MKRSYYALCLIPFVLTAIVAGFLIVGLVGEVEGMQRGVVPGTVDVTLEPGEYAVFAETRSKLGGVIYEADTFSLRCTLTSAAGTPVLLETPVATTSYTFGDYSGTSIHKVDLASRGTYKLACQSDTTPRIVVAVGHGIGGKLVTALVLFFAGCVASIIGFVMMYRRRKQWLAARRG